MKTTLKALILLLITGSMIFTACKKDETNPVITLSSLKSGSTDLYGATTATGVSVTESIIAVFSTSVDASTANTTNITLVRGTVSETLTITTSGSTVTIDPTSDLITGTSYTLKISGLKSDKGESLSAVTVSFTTAGVGLDTPPQKEAQVMYLQLNGTVADLTANATVASEQVAWTTDRFGTANGAADFRGATAPGNGDLIELSGSTFINASTTISVWYKIDVNNYIAPGNKPMFGIAAENGYFFEMGDGASGPGWIKFTTDHIVSPDPMNHLFGTAWNDINGSQVVGGNITYAFAGSVTDLVKDTWHLFTVTYDNTTYLKTIFMDGVKIQQWNLMDANGEWNLKDVALNTTVAGVDPKLALGYFCSKANTATGWADFATSSNAFKGFLDDFRIFNKALTNLKCQRFMIQKSHNRLI